MAFAVPVHERNLVQRSKTSTFKKRALQALDPWTVERLVVVFQF